MCKWLEVGRDEGSTPHSSLLLLTLLVVQSYSMVVGLVWGFRQWQQ